MWIWQHGRWPKFEFDAQALQPVLAGARLAQGRMLGVAEGLGMVELGALQLGEWAQEAVATAEIEGEILQVNSVRASAARRLGLAANPAARDMRTEATLDVLQAAVTGWERPLTEEALLSWHAALFPDGRSGLTRITPGAWRTHAEAMQIVTPQIGRPDIVHYEAPASADVPPQMRQLLDWFEATRAEGALDGIARSAVAHLWFEVVHPFEDGNGRIGRALAELALSQDLRSPLRLFSLSQQLLADRTGYYGELNAASRQASMDITRWIAWFAACIEKACLATVEQVRAAGAKSRFWSRLDEAHAHLTASQRKVINKLYDAGPGGGAGGMSTEKYVAITRVSRATAYRELTALAEAGLLLRTGQGRGTRYQLVTPP